MSTFTDFLINKSINSGFVKSRIQAWARVGAIALASYLVTHHVANQAIASDIVGSIVGLVALYLQDLDVKVVDGKIKVALNTNPPDSTPSGPLSPDAEKAETAALNNAESAKNK